MTLPRCYRSALAYEEDNPICVQCPARPDCAPEATRMRIALVQMVKETKMSKVDETPDEEILVEIEEIVEPEVIEQPDLGPSISHTLPDGTVIATADIVERPKSDPSPAVEPVAVPDSVPVPEPGQEPEKPTQRPEGLSKKGEALVATIRKAVNHLPSSLNNGENPFDGKTPKYLDVACKLAMAGKLTRQNAVAAFKEQFGWSDGTAGSHWAIIQSAFLHLGFTKTDEGLAS